MMATLLLPPSALSAMSAAAVSAARARAVAAKSRDGGVWRNLGLSRPCCLLSAAQWPKRRNFECDSYKMAIKITPAKKFLLNIQPELHQAIEEKSCTNSTICTQGIHCTKKDFFHL
jgi:hypothetical protein